MNCQGQSIHLLREGFEEGRNCRAASPPNFDSLEILSGTSYLAVEKSDPPHLVAEPDRKASEVFILETVWENQSPQLLMLVPKGHCARVNGDPAPPVALLKEKDEVAFDISSAHVAHVTVFNRPRIGSPPEKAIGKQCPICRVSVDRESTVYLCPRCDVPLHCEGEGKGEDRLECARICSKCPICATPITMQAGYSYLPGP